MTTPPDAHYDVIVAGLGAMGSAAVYCLAGRGLRVLGLDRFHPPHDLGSSHGRTRIIREAYFEHPLYVPLVRRAYELWTELERRSGRRLLVSTGGLMIGPPEGVLVRGARRSAEEHRLEHQVLTPAQLRERFPVFTPADDMVAVWEPRAGILFPELAIQTQLELAAQNGATLQFNDPVLSWEPAGDGVRVRTESGVWTARRLLLTAGAWMGSLVRDLELPLTVERQFLCWFEPRPAASGPAGFLAHECPIHLWEYAPQGFFYGFPDLGDGVKIGMHHQGETVQPGRIRRDVSDVEVEVVRSLVRRFLPEADGALKSSAVCMYTNTPDEHFILDFHPRNPQVLIASACSGHGFKFSTVIGELAAALLNGEQPSHDLTLFKVGRFEKRRD